MSRQRNVSSRNPRRQFLGDLAAGAAALAATAYTPATAMAQLSSPGAGPVGTQDLERTWDTSWMERLTGKHRAVFDSPEIGTGVALYHAFGYLDAVKQVFGGSDADASVVVVLRHLAVPMLFNDAAWAKYEIGTETETTDQHTDEPATRNIYWQNLDADGNPIVARPTSTIRSLSSRGVIFLGCDVATHGYAFRLARKTNQEPSAVYAELTANLVPGAILMPTGIFATLLAQEAGCSFMKSS